MALCEAVPLDVTRIASKERLTNDEIWYNETHSSGGQKRQIFHPISFVVRHFNPERRMQSRLTDLFGFQNRIEVTKDRLIVMPRSRNFVDSHKGPHGTPSDSIEKPKRPSLNGSLLATNTDMVVNLSAHSKEPVLEAAHFLINTRVKPGTGIGQSQRQAEGYHQEGENQNRQFPTHSVTPPFLSSVTNKGYHTLVLSVLCLTIAGCAAVSDLGIGKRKEPVPEYQQAVGLVVHDKPEQFTYVGSSKLDIPDLNAFHVQQVLPFTMRELLAELFSEVVVEKDPRDFMDTSLPGYFEVKVSDMRYDFQDPGAQNYRADATILVEFKSLLGEPLWKGEFKGSGVGYVDPDIRISTFSQASGIAVQEALDNAVDKMYDGIRNATPLRELLRRTSAATVSGAPTGAAEQEATA